MPVKKTTSAPAKAAPVKKDHKHAELESSLASLQKEVEALRKQCESCCAEIKELKAAQPAAAAQDPRVDKLWSWLKHANSINEIKKNVIRYES